MSKTSRREMLKKVGAAGTVAAGLGLAPINSRSASLDEDDNGPLANATVSFGEWMTTPPLDRYPNESPMTANHHELIPKTVKIKAGGTVNYIIGGLHHVLVYDDGTQPSDIRTTPPFIRPTTGVPAGVPLINDPNRRIYAGLDPSRQPNTFDRLEVVHFPNPGTYLVICGVLPHFVRDRMFGFVRVLPNRSD
jgi:plastocyanin